MATLFEAVHRMLEDLEDDVLDFVDDLLLILRPVDEHCYYLEKLQQRIRAAGVMVRFLKLELFWKEIKFLGYILTLNGEKIDPSKVQGLHDFVPPWNLTQLRGFLGLINFTLKYTDQITRESKRLYKLLKAGRKWQW